MAFFYDTCALLNKQDEAFTEFFYISNITLKELEMIKTSNIKDEDTKFKARKLIHLLDSQEDKYEIINYESKWDIELNNFTILTDNNDSKIILCALNCKKSNIIFVTEDLSCKQLAKNVGLNVQYYSDNDLNSYKGFYELVLNDEEMSKFYLGKEQYLNNNNINLYNNQYLIIKNENNIIIDKYKFFYGVLKEIPYFTFDSKLFGKIKPKDEYQQCAFDSLVFNQMTVLRGQAGSGKSLIGLAYLMQELEKGKINKIIMFVNPVATKDSCKFGFLPGSATEKILGSQIGNFLQTKLGDKAMAEKMIEDGDLVLIPVADARGIDLSGINAGVYLTEAQNTTIEIMKLLLQRIGEDSKVIFEGDDATQVDMNIYNGTNNGLKRLSNVFRGEEYYGEVTLQKCYRSRIADKAELM